MGSTLEPPEEPAAYRAWVLRRFVVPGLFVVVLFVMLWVRRDEAASAPAETALSGATMGTRWNVKLVSDGPLPNQAALEAQAAVERVLGAIVDVMSTYEPDSELSRFNASEDTSPRPVSAALAEVVGAAQDVGRRSGGAFDVTVGPLVDAWGFGPEGATDVPTEAELAALRERVGPDVLRVDLGAGTLAKARPDVRVDLSAIAKGYAVDQAAEALGSLGHSRFMVEVGGEVVARGTNRSGAAWRIGVEAPLVDTRQLQTAVPLTGRAMATSGDYRNYREVDGVRVSHTVDPRTGRPISHRLASVTVVADTCMAADAWATALNVLGPDEGMALAEREGLAVLMLVRTVEDPERAFEERRSSSLRAMPGLEPVRPAP